MTIMRSRGRMLTGAVFGLAFAAFASVAAAAVPTPVVEGPIPSDPASANRNYMFLATDLDLAGRGYVEQEFFYSGSANRYDVPVPAHGAAALLANANVVSSAPYKTRMVVRRPTDPQKFSGVVIVEWTNVTSLYDNPLWWRRAHEYVMREGHAFVSVASQAAAISGHATDALKNWNPARYGSLGIPDDELSYDVYAQGIKAVRSVSAVMGGLPVRTVIAGGHSQSARFLGTYFNAIHPRDPIVDGALMGIGGTQVRPDIAIPVLRYHSETEIEGGANAPIVPDGVRGLVSQADAEKVRTWYVMGTSHADHHQIDDATSRRDMPNRSSSLSLSCPLPTVSRVHWHHADAAAIDAMIKWVRDGAAPARSPRPTYTSMDPPTLARDPNGNALGGIRLPSFAVPIATSTGLNPAAPGCGNLLGTSTPFDTAKLAKLYPTHDAYVQAFSAAAEQSVRDGFLLRKDADEEIAEAQNSLIGTGLICGAVCADVQDFVRNPSTSNLRDHTAAYYFRGGDKLVATLDQATRLVAEGYTFAAKTDAKNQMDAKERFTRAIAALRTYTEQVRALGSDGRAQPVTTDLLTDYANAVMARIATTAQLPVTAAAAAAISKSQ